MSTTVPTFVGPVFREDRTKKTYSFYVLQGTSTLQLDYDDHATAQQNRASICDALYTHQVRSNSLLQAIQKALTVASAGPLSSRQEGDTSRGGSSSPDEKGDGQEAPPENNEEIQQPPRGQ